MSLRRSREALGVPAFGERDRISAASKDIDVLFVRVRRTDSQSAVTGSIIKEQKVNSCLLAEQPDYSAGRISKKPAV